MGADARPQALLALAPDAVMLAYARSAAFLARALLALVGADARPQALLALAPAAVMLAYLRSPAFLARALAALVRADARSSALLAPALLAVMLAFARRHARKEFLGIWGLLCLLPVDALGRATGLRGSVSSNDQVQLNELCFECPPRQACVARMSAAS